jgi:hypothetical protein
MGAQYGFFAAIVNAQKRRLLLPTAKLFCPHD